MMAHSDFALYTAQNLLLVWCAIAVSSILVEKAISCLLLIDVDGKLPKHASKQSSNIEKSLILTSSICFSNKDWNDFIAILIFTPIFYKNDEWSILCVFYISEYAWLVTDYIQFDLPTIFLFVVYTLVTYKL